MPELDMKAAETQLETGLADVSRSVTDIGAAHDDLTARVNRILAERPFIPNPADDIARVLALAATTTVLPKIRADTEKLQSQSNLVVNGGRPIFSLIDTAVAWADHVKGPVSGLGTAARTPSVDGLYLWTGPAATAYGDKRIAQQGAITAVDTLVGGIPGWLAQIAIINVNFVSELALLLIGIIEKLIAAVLDLSSIVGFLQAIGEFADAIAAGVAAVGEGFVRYYQSLFESEGLRVTAKTLLNSNTGLDGERWPQAVRPHR